MKYIAKIDAFDELDVAQQANSVMLIEDTSLTRMKEQRLLIQSLLLDPPALENDTRLQQLLHMQTSQWLEKMKKCVQAQLCVRLPDGPIEAFLPNGQRCFQ